MSKKKQPDEFNEFNEKMGQVSQKMDDMMNRAMRSRKRPLISPMLRMPRMPPMPPMPRPMPPMPRPRVKDFDRTPSQSIDEALAGAGLIWRRLITVTPSEGEITERHMAVIDKINATQEKYEIVPVKDGIPITDFNVDGDVDWEDGPLRKLPPARIHRQLTTGERVRQFFRRLWPRKRLRLSDRVKVEIVQGSIADTCEICFGVGFAPTNGDISQLSACPVCRPQLHHINKAIKTQSERKGLREGCATCGNHRDFRTHAVCLCGDSRPPFKNECSGFDPSEKHPLLCINCGCGKKARDEHYNGYWHTQR